METVPIPYLDSNVIRYGSQTLEQSILHITESFERAANQWARHPIF